jgi:hypothetical protein
VPIFFKYEYLTHFSPGYDKENVLSQKIHGFMACLLRSLYPRPAAYVSLNFIHLFFLKKNLPFEKLGRFGPKVELLFSLKPLKYWLDVLPRFFDFSVH